MTALINVQGNTGTANQDHRPRLRFWCGRHFKESARPSSARHRDETALSLATSPQIALADIDTTPW